MASLFIWLPRPVRSALKCDATGPYRADLVSNRSTKRTPKQIAIASINSRVGFACQSAFKFDPVSASNFDPLERLGLAVALVSSELAGIAETRRAR
ncbi:hypothetical protein, partial [Bradyrhizobium elkanii]|uniref:hypothetical protein n=2 Tax=Bradyrhizobium TaxID=374 RepID=UPI001AEBFB03